MSRKWKIVALVSIAFATVLALVLLLPIAELRHGMLKQLKQTKIDRELERLSLERRLRDELDRTSIDQVRGLAQNELKEWDNQWFGVPILQFPTDLWIYQDLLWEVKPEFVVETGTFHGGTALYLASLMERIPGDAKVITVDIDGDYWRKTLATAAVADQLKHRVIFLEGSSVKPEVYSSIAEKVAGKNVLVILDSNHEKDHVLGELRLYSKLVPLNGYLIVNDTDHDKTQWLDFQEGPLAAVHAFLEENDDFVIDASRERFMISCFHSGILRRVRPEAKPVP